MRTIIHIGLHKTGTSALQSFLHRNAIRLADHGICYAPPMPDAWPNHNPMIRHFKEGPDSLATGMSKAREMIARANGRDILISAEMLCEPGVDVPRFLSAWPNPRAIAYIRHPCDIVISAFNEVVRHHAARWVRSINERPFAYPPSQATMLVNWLKTNLTIAPYDKQQWVGGTIFSDFLAMIGVSVEGFDYTSANGNESIPHPLAEVLRIVNGEVSVETHGALVRHLRTISCDPGPYPLPAETVEKFISMMREALPLYRPHFRPGFQEAFLIEPRSVR